MFEHLQWEGRSFPDREEEWFLCDDMYILLPDMPVMSEEICRAVAERECAAIDECERIAGERIKALEDALRKLFNDCEVPESVNTMYERPSDEAMGQTRVLLEGEGDDKRTCPATTPAPAAWRCGEWRKERNMSKGFWEGSIIAACAVLIVYACWLAVWTGKTESRLTALEATPVDENDLEAILARHNIRTIGMYPGDHVLLRGMARDGANDSEAGMTVDYASGQMTATEMIRQGDVFTVPGSLYVDGSGRTVAMPTPTPATITGGVSLPDATEEAKEHWKYLDEYWFWEKRYIDAHPDEGITYIGDLYGRSR